MSIPRILAIAGLVFAVSASPVVAQPGASSVHFDAGLIGGANGQVLFSGQGAFDPATGFVRLNGTFRCVADIRQGPLNGLLAGEGVRWRAVELLPSSGFKCSGDAAEVAKTVATDARTVVFLAEFFRAGDGARGSLQAKVFVSADDQASDLPGLQNVWIQGIGCSEALVNLR